MRQLRNYGIYEPPGGVRPVYAVRAEGGYYLYDSEHGVALAPRFRVEPDGGVTDWHGEPAGLRVEDLIDTGQTRQVSSTTRGL